MPDRAIFFDLDGTLVDTAPDLAQALNDLLSQYRLPKLPQSSIRPYISKGAQGLIQLAFANTPHSDVRSLSERLVAHYQRLDHRRARLFAPWPALLEQAPATVLGIVTNKPRALTERLLYVLELEKYFSVVICGDDHAEQKPNPLPLLKAAERLGIEPQHCLYIGDAKTDMIAAQAAGMRPVLASWGYFLPKQPEIERWPYQQALCEDKRATDYCVNWLNGLDCLSVE